MFQPHFRRSARQIGPSLATCLTLWIAAVVPAPPALAQTGAAGASEAEPRPGPTAHEKVGPGVLEAIARDGKAAVIVAFAARATQPVPRRHLRALQAEVAGMQRAVLDELRPGDFRAAHVYSAVPALAGWVTAAGLERLARHPFVLEVGLDLPVRASLAESVPLIEADRWHDKDVKGGGVTVAVLDTGVDRSNHGDLNGALVVEECFLERAPGHCPDGTGRQSGNGAAADDEGHGTHVSGIVLSEPGVAPEASLAALKVLDGGGGGALSDIVAGLEFILTDLPGVQVINMSLGTETTFDGECDDEDAGNRALAWILGTLRALGVTPIAASGNGKSQVSMASPACLSSVVSVGATDKDDAVASFTNVSPELDLMAPGVDIESSALGGGTTTKKGTSMAAPHAAGCAALLLQSGLASAPDEVESWLTTSQVTVEAAGEDFPRLECLPPDHFLCYLTPEEVVFFDSVAPGTLVELEDRFDRALGAKDLRELGTRVRFCNPVQKTHGGSVSKIHHEDHHLTFYHLEPPADPLDWTVQVKNQFGVQELQIGAPNLLAVPTQKEPHDPPEGLDHYKCYEAMGEFLDVELLLDDQFQSEGVVVNLFTFLFCNPVLKAHDDTVTEIRKPGEHLVCYLTDPTIQLEQAETRLLTNQFESWQQELEQADLLCVPSADVSAGPASTGTLTVCKEVVPDDDSLWDFTLHGPSPGFAPVLGNGDCHVLNDLRPGGYRLEEVIPPPAQGLYSTSVACSNGATGDESVVFGVTPGSSATCTFTNEPEWAPGPGDCDSVEVSGLDVQLITMEIPACRELRAGPDVTVDDAGNLHLAGGERVILVDGFQVGDSGSLRLSSCGHDLCQAAPDPLADGCHPCVTDICSFDDVCCTEAWDQRCVGQLWSVCGLRCP